MADKGSIPHGLSLRVANPTQAPLHPDRCIICQEKGKSTERLHGAATGRKRVREAAEVKNDDVNKRLKVLGPDSDFKYHNTYSCYKKYTDVRYLPTIPEVPADDATEDLLPDLNTHKPSTRSSTLPRPGPSTTVDSDYIDCVICASDRVWVKTKGKQVREKFRLCKVESAQKFLDAMNFHKDEVYVRCADIGSPQDVYASDLYCHVSCFKQYVSNSKQTEPFCDKRINHKNDVFTDVMTHLDPLIQAGYGFTMTEIKEMMMNLDDSIYVYNRDVKRFLTDYYGDRIQCCPSHMVNEPEMCFSADISIEDLGRKLRNNDVIRSAGEILREAFKQVDFKLANRFCDGNELKESWENTPMPDQLLTFFAALFGIRRSRMVKIEMLDMVSGDCDDDEVDSEGDTSSDDNAIEVEWAVRNQHTQLNCLFQIMYNQLFHGAKKTPLSASFGQYQYGKSRSREVLTAANRMGISSSYNDVRRSRRLLAAYAVAKSEGNEVPVPSTFTRGAYICGAMDNGDFSDRSSLSGTESDHVTMQVLYQEIISPPESKPYVSDMNLQKSTACLPVKLPCQYVPCHSKPLVKPSLPPNFHVIDETGIDSNLDCVSALRVANNREFLISFIRYGLPKDGSTCDTLPTWGGSHALLSTAVVPLMRVGFLPVIPSPVTDYATVRKGLQNFQSVHRQLNPSQSLMPVFCDEGVFHTVADIIMDEPNEFSDLHGMMGMFHWVKILLKCAGRYLRGSGIEDALIETEVFGKLTLNSVLEGSHYVRSFHGIIMVSDMISSLTWEAFWQWLEQHDRKVNDAVMTCAGKVQSALCEKKRSVELFAELVDKSSELQEHFEHFVNECCEKSEMCQYLQLFQHMAVTIKHAVASDREGNFPLHIAAVEASLPIFRESDCLNYLRYGSFYLETTKVLEATHPEFFRHFMRGQFVVKDHASGYFNAVAPDMKLEQSIQRTSKSDGGIVGQTRNLAIVVEWQLIFHEILLVSNNFREMMNDVSMSHSESSSVHHELTGRKAAHLNENVAKLLDFIRDRGNPYIIEAPGIKLYNLTNKQLSDNEVAVRLLQVQANGDRLVREFRKERFLEKTKKLSITISKRALPQMDYKPPSENNASPVTVSPKMIAAAQRDIEIVKERGMTLDSIYGHDILPVSTIFEGDLPSKPDKSTLIAELEKYITDDDMHFPGGDFSVILDFMSKIRSFPNLASFVTFGRVVSCVLSAGRSICSRTSLHVVFDSYLDSSVKASERLRRTGGVVSVDLTEVTEDVPVPQQLDKFWTSSANKVKLQQLTRQLASTPALVNLIIVLSGCITDEEVVPAQLLHAGRVPGSLSTESPEAIEALTCHIEEADDRLILHCAWEVDRGSSRLLVISNDTDTITRLLRFIPQLRERGLQELWVEFGSGERKRYLPLHVLTDKLGIGLCMVIVKAHVLTGDDALSKIGTKHASLTCEPGKFLYDFAESHQLTDEVVKKVEEYLVRVWFGAKCRPDSRTFDQLRVECHIRATTPKPLEALPPTSSVIRGHIQRAFFVLRNVLSLLDHSHSIPDPTNYGWVIDNDMLLPVKGLNPLPHGKLVICKCMGKCDTKRCPCKKVGTNCVIFCHKQQGSECKNSQSTI